MAALFYAIAYFVLGAQLLQVDAAMAGSVWVTSTCECVKDQKTVGSHSTKLCAPFDSGACSRVESECVSEYTSECYYSLGGKVQLGTCVNSGSAC